MLDSIRDRVVKAITREREYGPSELKGIDRLQADLGFDSLAMTELQVALEDEFGVEMSDSLFHRVYTVGGLIAFVAREV